MPLYEYQCDACGKRFEKIQKFSDAPLEVCTLCGKGPVHKLMSSPAIQFKGSGWYITDYAKKGSTASGETGASTKTESSEKPAEKKSDSVPAKSDSSSTTTSKD
jgi:putative FmdB family regulatory protein